MADDPVIGIVGRVGAAVRQKRGCRAGHRAGEPVAHIVVTIGDGGIRPRFLRQLALIVVGIARDPRGIRDAGPLAVGSIGSDKTRRWHYCRRGLQCPSAGSAGRRDRPSC